MATIEELQAILLDEAQPIAMRNQSIFFIKNIGGHEAVDALATALILPSVLLAHEAAYVLGQIGDKYAVPCLTATLEAAQLDPIVRHEAAEALAAIGKTESLDILERFINDESPEVADTCQIAVMRIRWRAENPELADTELDSNPYKSIDPAPGHTPETFERTATELQELLNDTSLPLFDRYKAMFALRNIGNDEAVAALASGFEDKSAVFRHEIAYVMGQIQQPAAIASLKKVLANEQEHAMVRHEAAEALGAIAEGEVETILDQYKDDKDIIVKQSCEVAMSIADYWNGFEKGEIGGGDDNEFH